MIDTNLGPLVQETVVTTSGTPIRFFILRIDYGQGFYFLSEVISIRHLKLVIFLPATQFRSGFPILSMRFKPWSKRLSAIRRGMEYQSLHRTTLATVRSLIRRRNDVYGRRLG